MLVKAGLLFCFFTPSPPLLHSTSYDLIYKAEQHMFLEPTITLLIVVLPVDPSMEARGASAPSDVPIEQVRARMELGKKK